LVAIQEEVTGMKLVFKDVYGIRGKATDEALEILYCQLKGRPPEANISHHKMPSLREHIHFVDSRPYNTWHLVYDGEELIGQVYVTRQFELGIFVEEKHRRKGYGKAIVGWVLKSKLAPGILANVAPGNAASQKFFESLGFKVCQWTYRWEGND
jgi:RimJ/RimL family protein N-acetyltransferase